MKMFIIKITAIVLALITIILIGFGLKCHDLDNKIRQLSSIDTAKSAELVQMRADAHVIKDNRAENDINYLNSVFSDIFTFYDLEGFNTAKGLAIDYNFPEAFVYNLFDTAEIDQSLYAESMLKIACQYNNSDIYLLEKKDNYYYICKINISLVEYDAAFSLILFIELSDDIDNKIVSATYYQAE